jgi:hypothetical protein
MAFLPLRRVELPDAATAAAYDAWLGGLAPSWPTRPATATSCAAASSRRSTTRNSPGWTRPAAGRGRVALLQMDPRNITLEPEYYAEIDVERYARSSR